MITKKDITREFILNNYDIDKERGVKQIKQKISIIDEVLSTEPRTLETFFNDITKKVEEFKKSFKDNKIEEIYISGYQFYEDIDVSLTTYLIRPETDTEVIERLMKNKKNQVELKRKKQKRYQQYLKLKEEFGEDL